jgi:hypothetical protein
MHVMILPVVRRQWHKLVNSDVMCRYKVLAQQTKEDARCAFMRILRTLPYGNATFFAVRRIGEQLSLHRAGCLNGVCGSASRKPAAWQQLWQPSSSPRS